MKCRILFSGKNKKNIINLSSAENAQRVVKVNVISNVYCATAVMLGSRVELAVVGRCPCCRGEERSQVSLPHPFL